MNIIRKSFDSASEQETLAHASHLGKKLQGGEIIELVGDIGSGKTTFVKGLARGAGSRNLVTSPTFTIKQAYKGQIGLYHYDFYRLEDPGIMSHELEEAMGRPDTATVVEWAETVEGVLPKNRIRISLVPTSEHSRKIFVEIPKSTGWAG
jgi:tRNA threonylcarbamoyladenosine biosynthesis protein TsaE